MSSFELSIFLVMTTNHLNSKRSRLPGPDLIDGDCLRMDTLDLHSFELARRVRSQQQDGTLAVL